MDDNINKDSKFNEKSYDRHAKHYQEYVAGAKKSEQAKTWFNDDTIDAWRHRRMYANIDPLIITDPQASWLTVGDGRYGTDANYIIKKGGKALATDITDVLLIEAKAKKFITDYKVENTEKMSFPDETFDYVLCKESYHHFPRPMIALYEMLRVAKKGVVLIEPKDPYIADRPESFLRSCFRSAKTVVGALLGIHSTAHVFEPVGNYIFSISKRELEKVALGLNFRTVAFRGMNDYYEEGVEYEKAAADNALFKKVKKIITKSDFFAKWGYHDYSLLLAIILKEEPSPAVKDQLVQAGYQIIQLPKNPYHE